MVSAIRTIDHEDQLTLVDHLDELRARLIVSAAVLAVAFGVCFWQNHALLGVINKPLKAETSKQVAKGNGTAGQAVLAQQGVLKVAADTEAALGLLASPRSGLTPATRAALRPLERSLHRDVAAIPRNPTGDNPVTLGVGEPFTTTVTISLYFALIFSLPVILYELYGFIVPALKPPERRAAVPLLLAVPFLFALGVAFGYFIVLPAAVRFLVNFNSSEFNVLVQASQYYSFAATVLLAMGVVFQIPVVILGATRLGLVTPRQLRHNRRYAVLACAALAAFLPGDFITLILETVPLYLLYEVSILLAALVTPAGAGSREEDEGSNTNRGTRPPVEDPEPDPENPAGHTVQQIIDHVDESLTD